MHAYCCDTTSQRNSYRMPIPHVVASMYKERSTGHIMVTTLLQYYCTVLYGHTYSKSMDRPGKVASPARAQLNRKMNISLPAFVPENLVSRDGFDSPVPRKPAHLHTQAESGALLTGSLPSSAAASIYSYKTAIRHRVSPEFIGSRSCVPMAFTAESPPALSPKVVPNECCLGRSPSWTK